MRRYLQQHGRARNIAMVRFRSEFQLDVICMRVNLPL